MDARARGRAELSRKRWNATVARRVLAELATSGMSRTAFARTLGLNVQRLSWWRKRLGEAECPAAVTFVPAVVTRPGSRTIVRLPAGVEIEATDVTAVPAQWVAELVRSLTGTP